MDHEDFDEVIELQAEIEVLKDTQRSFVKTLIERHKDILLLKQRIQHLEAENQEAWNTADRYERDLSRAKAEIVELGG